MNRIHIALVGDFNENKHTHLALNDAVEHARSSINFEIKTLIDFLLRQHRENN